MKRRSFCEWIPILPWPVWPLAWQRVLGQNTVVGSMTLLLAMRGNIVTRSMSGPPFALQLHCTTVWCRGTANAIAPFLATVLVPSPWSTRVSSCCSAARCRTLAMNACQSDPSSAPLALDRPRARSITGLFSRPSSEPDVILIASSGSLVSLSLQLWPIEMDIIMTSLTQWDALAFPRDHDFDPERHLPFALFVQVS